MALLCLAPAAGRAQSTDAARAAARQHGTAGVEAYQAGDFALATDKLERAYAVLRVPTLGLWSARALAKTGRIVEAAARYREASALTISGGDVEIQKKAKLEAGTELASLEPTIPSLVIRLRGAEPEAVRIRVGEREVAASEVGQLLPLNPGAHQVLCVSGDQRVERTVTLAEGDRQELTLELSPSAPPPAASSSPIPAPPTARSHDSGASTRRTAGWVVVGGGAAALVVGGVAAGVANAKKTELDENPLCADDHRCPRNATTTPLVESYATWRTVSTVGFVASGVLLATGVVLVLTAPRSSTAVGVWVSPTSTGVTGRF